MKIAQATAQIPFLLLTCLFMNSLARADTSDVLNFTIGESVMFDDNIFRLSPDTPSLLAIGSSERGDRVINTSAGVTFDKRISRQQFQVDANFNQARYNRFSFLDYNGKDLKATWNWELAGHYFGLLRKTRSDSLTSFGDFRSPVKNVVTYDTTYASANWQLHPDWLISVSTTKTDGVNSSAKNTISNYESKALETGFRYTPRSNNSLGIKLRHTDAGYPNRQVVSGYNIDNTYRQDEVEADVVWQLTGLTKLSGYISNLRRRHQEAPNRNYSGPTGRIELDWFATGKATLNLAVRQDLSATDAALASYVLTRAVSITPTWTPTAKTSVQAMLERRQRRYQGDPTPIFSNTEKQTDKIKTLSLNISYQPVSAVQLGLSLRSEQRDSNITGSSYRDKLANLSVQFKF